MLSHVHKWCYKWQMKVNIEKIKIVHFPNKRRKTKFDFKIENCTLDIDNSYHYLGVLFDEHLDFDKCAKTLSDAAARALGSIITKFKQFKNIGYKTYNSGVSSILDYGASVWDYGNHKYGQQVQNRAITYFLGVLGMLQTLLFNLKWGGLMFSIIFIHVPVGIGIGFLK